MEFIKNMLKLNRVIYKLKGEKQMKKTISVLLLSLMASVLLVACAPKDNDNGTGETGNVDIKEVHEKIKSELGEDYFPSMELTLDELVGRTGVNPDNVDEFIAEIPMMSVHVDTFIAVKANDSEGEAVEASLEGYHNEILEQSANYPMNVAKVNASKVIRHGDYVFFVMLGAMDDDNDMDSSDAANFAEKENNRAIDVINSFFN